MSLFRSSFHPYVRRQLQQRQQLLADRDTPQTSPIALQWLNSKTAWIRLTSATDLQEGLARKLGVAPGAALARQHVLMGGELMPTSAGFIQRRAIGDGGGAYGDQSNGTRTAGQGLRPMAGITGLQIESTGAYGSTRKATLTFMVWTIEELERLELLYLRPGYTALLEWGWSNLLRPDGQLDTPKFFNILDAPAGQLKKEAVFDTLYRVKEKGDDNSPLGGPAATKPGHIESQHGCYDAFYGYVSNFEWSVDSGTQGYQCQMMMVSIGEVLESMKANYVSSVAPSKLAPGTTDQNTLKSYTASKLEGWLSYFLDMSRRSGQPFGEFTDPIAGAYRFPYVQKNVANAKTKAATSVYLRLEDLLDYINRDIIPADERGNPMVRLRVRDDQGRLLEGSAHYFQTSVDLSQCLIRSVTDDALLPNEMRVDWLDAKDDPKFNWFVGNGLYNRSTYGNLWLNIDFLLEMVKSLSSGGQSVDIHTYLTAVLDQCCRAIGGVNQLKLYNNPDSSDVYVVDMAYVEDRSQRKNKYQFQLNTAHSVVRSYTMNSSIFPDMANTIAIAAGVGGHGQFGIDTSSLTGFNLGLEDRIVRTRIEPGTAQLIDPAAESSRLQENVVAYGKQITEYMILLRQRHYPPAKNEPGKVQKITGPTYSNVEPPYEALAHLIQLEKEQQYKAGQTAHAGQAILPLRLSLTLDGIAGIQIGQVFTVNKAALPVGYRGTDAARQKVGFIVRGVSHQLDGNDWVTVLDTQTVLLDEGAAATKITRNIVLQKVFFVKV